MTPVRHQLLHLAQAYFHQDFDLEAPTPLDVVRLFRNGEPSSAVDELISDLKSVLDSLVADSDMRDLWIHEYGASYDPLTDGISYRKWFADVLDVMIRS
jgi:hypothetical protein